MTSKETPKAHKIALNKAKSNHVCVIEWLKPRLYVRRNQLAERAAELIFADPKGKWFEEIRKGDWVTVKGHDEGNIVELFLKSIGFPFNYESFGIVGLLNIVEEFQPDNKVKGGKKNV